MSTTTRTRQPLSAIISIHKVDAMDAHAEDKAADIGTVPIATGILEHAHEVDDPTKTVAVISKTRLVIYINIFDHTGVTKNYGPLPLPFRMSVSRQDSKL